MRWIIVWILVITLLSTSGLAKELVSSGSYISGDTIVIGPDHYTIFVSSSGSNILLENANNDKVILDSNKCFIKDEYETCLNSFGSSRNGQKIANINTYLFNPTVNVTTTIEKNNTFLGEENTIILNVKGDSDNDITHVYVEVFLPKEFTIESTSCYMETLTEGNKLYIYEELLEVDRKKSCEININSKTSQKHTFTPTYNYTYLNTFSKGILDPVNLEFNSHVNITYNTEEINGTKPFEFNISISGEIDNTIEVTSAKIYFPSYANIIRNPRDLESKDDENIDKNIFQVYQDNFNLDADEIKTYSFDLQTNSDLNFSIYTLLEYKIDNIKYQTGFEREDFEIDIPEENITGPTFKEFCDGKDFNITTAVGEGLSITSLEKVTLYAGNLLSAKIYSQSIVQENISWANIAITNDKDLLLKSTKSFTKLQKYNLGTVSKNISYLYNESSYDIDIRIDYYCQKSAKEFSFNKTISVPITTFEDITLVKDIDKTEFFGKETIQINVSIENPSDAEFYGLQLRESIPTELKVRGVTQRNLLVRANPEGVPDLEPQKAYTYYITAPDVNETTTYTIKTIMEVPVKNNTLTFEQEHILTISPNYNISLKLKEITEEGKLYVNEPTIITYEVENNDTEIAKSIVFKLNQTTTFDSTLISKNIGQLGPGEKYTFDITIIPKKNNVTITAQLTYLNLDSKMQKVETNISETYSASRTNEPYLNFNIDVIENETTNIFTYLITNPSKSNKEYIYFNGTTYVNDSIEGNKNKEITIIFKELPNKMKQNTELFGYKFFDSNFFSIPAERTYLYVEPPKPINETQINNTNQINQNQTLALEEVEKGILIPVLISLFVFTVILGGVIGTFVFSHKRDKPKITKEELDKAEKKGVGETHVMNATDQPKPKKGEHIDTTPIEKKKLEPTNIFSFDDYEELKKQLEDKENKHKKKK